MNDATRLELMKIVERAVRPVLAVVPRKRQFREEMLAHLTEVFEDELAKRGGEDAALDATRARFGDAAELTAQLQGSVSRWDRARVPLQQLFVRRMDESALRYVTRMSLGTAAASVVFFGVLFCVLAMLHVKEQPMRFAWRLALVEPVFIAMFNFGVVYIPMQLGPALYDAPRSWSRAITYLLASVPLLPGLAAFFHGALLGELTTAWPQIRLACYFALLMPLAMTALARLMWQEFTADRAWAELRIDS